jgi:hypothetical protein
VVRVVAGGHLLRGRALRARRGDTDVLGATPAVTARDGTTLSGEGARRLLGLLGSFVARGAVDVVAGERSSR